MLSSEYKLDFIEVQEQFNEIFKTNHIFLETLTPGCFVSDKLSPARDSEYT
jgi:hypothetical protein